MVQKIISGLLLSLMLPLIITVSRTNAEPAKLAQVVYITLSKACNCTLECCQAGDWVVERVFTGEKKTLLKRFDYAADKDAVR